MPRRVNGSKPDYLRRANTGDQNSTFMVTIGAARQWKEGDGFVVRLHSIPTDWDGSMILAPPQEGQEDEEPTP